MLSQRRNDLLDATRAGILEIGWRRMTMTDVARRSGVSRMTLYRTWPAMDALLGDLLTREWESIVAGLPPEAMTERSPAGIARGVLGIVRGLRTNALFRTILDVDPEVVVPYLFDRPGRSQESALALLAEVLEPAIADGSVRGGDPAVLARTLLLLAHGHTLSIRTMTDDAVSEEALDEELVEILTRGLTP